MTSPNAASTGQPTLRTFFKAARRLQQRIFSAGTTDQHWVRVVMDEQTQNLVSGLQPETLDALEISGTQWKSRARFKSYRTVDFPEFDVCETVLGESFDLVIAEQVLEHVLWPYRAGRNVLRMLRPGGHFLLTTPFLLRYHPTPEDCTRWTETGIRYFLAECGFPLGEIRTGSWGNRSCLGANLRVWKRYRPGLHSLRNDPEYPLVVWALARRD